MVNLSISKMNSFYAHLFLTYQPQTYLSSSYILSSDLNEHTIYLVAKVRNLGTISNPPFSTHPLNHTEFVSFILTNMSISLHHHSYYLNSAFISELPELLQSFPNYFFLPIQSPLHWKKKRNKREKEACYFPIQYVFNMKSKSCGIYTKSLNYLAPTHFSRLRSLQHPSYILKFCDRTIISSTVKFSHILFSLPKITFHPFVHN